MPKKTTIQTTSEEKVIAKKAPIKKRKIEEVDEEEDHIVEEPLVKKTKAKASVAKVSSASNATKSELDETVEEVSEESEDEVRKAPSAKKSKATTAKSSTAKTSSASNAKKRKLEDRLEEESEESEDEVKKAPSAKRTVKPSTAKKAKSSAASEEYSSSEDEEFEEPTKAKKGGKSSSGSKVSTAKKSTSKSSNAMDITEKDVKGKKKAEDDDGDDEGEVMVIPPTDFKTPLLAPGELKIVSWNVAGFRAVQKKGFEAYIKQESPDVICLQETKISSASEMLYGYHATFFGCKAKPGLHGTGILSKEKPMKVELISTLDEEGRVMVAEFDKFFILNTYVPHSGQKLERIPFRLEWDKGLQALFLSLQKTKPVLWCGDLNVAHHPIDIANPTGNKRTAGFTEVERKSFGDFLSANGLIDTYRTRNPEEKDCYSFWTYKRQSRSKNIGWRMDYFIVSPNIDSFITQAYIRKHIHGSEYATQHKPI